MGNPNIVEAAMAEAVLTRAGSRSPRSRAAYARAYGQAFLTRAGSCDTAPESYEATWTRPATPADLTDMGRKQLGLQPR
jgi:hypothetical protein